jgi:hypothetical protein
MTRSSPLAVLVLVLAPAARAAVPTVEFVPAAPQAAPTAALSGAAAAIAAPSILAAPALAALSPVPALASALTPALAAAPAASLPAFQAPRSADAAPAAPNAPAAAAAAPIQLPHDPAGRPAGAVVQLSAVASEAAAANAERFFDAAPAPPDFDALTPIRAPQAPARWAPRAALLKPVAAAVNAWRAARHERRMNNLGPNERVTAEEDGLREHLTELHAALAANRPQDVIDVVARYFATRDSASWYAGNARYLPYRSQAFAYLRFAERAVMNAYLRADARGDDESLVAEARAAARRGAVLGHSWRPTAVQAKDSSHCVQNALFNAIMASVGFTRPTTISDFVAASRAALNREAKLDRPAAREEIEALARELNLNFGRRDVGDGMATDALREWTSLLGMKFAAPAPPTNDAGWSALLGPDREVLLSLRMFHPHYFHSPELAALRGHDFMILHHEVYLLGAFDSPSRGARFYMIQDSGSGATLMATAEELTALTQEVQVVGASAPIALPGAASPR